jgi:capsule polysaccharide export protein KpsC/LpsZ
MTTRLINLTISTKGAEEWFTTFQEISELAANLGASHDYVSVSSVVPDETSEDVPDEDLYDDEETLIKVNQAIRRAFLQHGASDDVVVNQFVIDAISEMQNAGILFRERTPS